MALYGCTGGRTLQGEERCDSATGRQFYKMRTKRVLRYFCDHCKKGGQSKHHMARHESRCTRNPIRVCGFCLQVDRETPSMANLILALRGGIENLREVSENCPGCILSAIIQSGFQEPPSEENPNGVWYDFKYKEEVKQFWIDHAL